jgi:hypothetical protein
VHAEVRYCTDSIIPKGKLVNHPSTLCSLLLAALALLAGIRPAPAQIPGATPPLQDAARTLLPILDLFANPPASKSRSLTLEAEIEALGSNQFQQPFPSFQIILAPPKKAVFSTKTANLPLQIGRDNDTLWAAPASVIQPIVQALESPDQVAPPKRTDLPMLVRPMQIPVPGKILSLLPMLFDAKDSGKADFLGKSARLVDVRVMPELAQLLGPELTTSSLRLWLDDASGSPVRVGGRFQKESAVIRIKSLQFSPETSPASTNRPENAITIQPHHLNAISALLRGETPTRR